MWHALTHVIPSFTSDAASTSAFPLHNRKKTLVFVPQRVTSRTSFGYYVLCSYDQNATLSSFISLFKRRRRKAWML